VAEYWIVDPEDDLIERNRFGGAEPGRPGKSEAHGEKMPLVLAGRQLGFLDLADVFVRDF
jgi:hypothetical protein